MTESTTTRLFVYGTLKPGHGNYGRITHLVRSSCPASTHGVLIDLGAFPAMIPGPGQVSGVLLEVDEDALIITDRIEGFDPDGGRSLYNRKKGTIRLESGEEVAAWVYEFANPDRIAGGPRPIVNWTDGIPVFEWPLVEGASLRS